ncbi:MAG TPA: FlgD immunoglobulin-like domain containing protein [bacterium]|nr:FlgD immunoglobulin-like domain containing protein [bacterium]
MGAAIVALGFSDAPCGGVPAVLLWKPPGVLGASPDSVFALLTALGEDCALTSDLFQYSPDLNVHEAVYAFLGIYPFKHLLSDPEGSALDNFVFDGGRLVVEGGDCFNYDPEQNKTYDIRPIFGLLDGPDGTRDLFNVTGMNDLAQFTFQYLGPNQFTDDLIPFSSIPVMRNSANSDIAGVFHLHYGAGRAIGFSFELGRLVDVPSILANTKLDLLRECLRLLRNTDPPAMTVSTTTLADSLFTGDSNGRTFDVANPGTLNSNLFFSISENPPVPWLGISPQADTLSGNGISTITATFDATGMPLGSYTTDLIVTGNAPANPADTVAVSLLVTNPPDLAVTPDSLFFEVHFMGGTDEDSLTLSNTGEAPLEFSLAMDQGGAERCEFGSQMLSFTGGSRFRGNIYRADTAAPLRSIEHLATINGSTTLEFFAYQGNDSSGAFSKIFSMSKMSDTGTGWFSSGQIDVAMQAGKFYFIGMGWLGSVTYFNDGGFTPLPVPLSFGACLGAAGANVYPPPASTTIAPAQFLNSQAIEFGETADVEILSPLQGTILPAQNTSVHLQAIGGALIGTFPATLLITSNDPTRSISTILPFPLRVHVTDPTGAPWMPTIPVAALHPGVPNPFRSQTQIRFDLPQDTSLRLCIYDVEGRLVRTLASGMESAGSRSVVWDGRDDAGREVAAGVFFSKLEAKGKVLVQKSILLR